MKHVAVALCAAMAVTQAAHAASLSIISESDDPLAPVAGNGGEPDIDALGVVAFADASARSNHSVCN